MNKQTQHSSHKLIITLILITLTLNFIYIFAPLIREDDPALYASIAKNMVLNHNFAYLYKDHVAWLDKPHLLFWLSAASFRIFGFQSFAYILPGFLFYILGGIYTYRLTVLFYQDKESGLFAALCYFTACHLLISSIDSRAEAYLLGMIMPACYYWYIYDISSKINGKALLAGAMFTAFAIMTKGIFLLITIISGLCCLWVYQNRWRNFISIKWILALILSFIFAAPEIVSSYIQFGTKSLYWFFWGSQFGRFLNIGKITQTNVSVFHDIFFIHTFLWSFLPWTLIFFVAAWYMIKRLCENKLDSKHKFSPELSLIQEKQNIIYLFGSFGVTFTIFSLSKFQLDYYINVILPFATMICGQWLHNIKTHRTPDLHNILKFQIYMAGTITLFTIISGSIAFDHNYLYQTIITDLALMIITVAILFIRNGFNKAIILSVFAINLAFATYMSLYYIFCPNYDIGYQAAKFLNKQPIYPIIGYKFPSSVFSFNYKYNNMLLFYPKTSLLEIDKIMNINPVNVQIQITHSIFPAGILNYATNICLIAKKLNTQINNRTNKNFDFYFITQDKYSTIFLQKKYTRYFSLTPIKNIHSMTSDQVIKSVFDPSPQNLIAGMDFTIFRGTYNYSTYCTK